MLRSSYNISGNFYILENCSLGICYPRDCASYCPLLQTEMEIPQILLHVSFADGKPMIKILLLTKLSYVIGLQSRGPSTGNVLYAIPSWFMSDGSIKQLTYSWTWICLSNRAEPSFCRYPELEWDFRLKNVVSINASGHKYGGNTRFPLTLNSG